MAIRGKAGSKVQRVEIVAGQDASDAIVTVTHSHRKSHEGDMFAISRVVEGVADDGTIDILIALGQEAHITWRTKAGGDALATFYENPTVSDNGTLMSQVNLSRLKASSNPGPGNVYHTPTITDVGTQLVTELLPGGTGGNAVGVTLSRDAEFIMHPDNTYLLRLQNIAGNAQPLGVVAQYYIR